MLSLYKVTLLALLCSALSSDSVVLAQSASRMKSAVGSSFGAPLSAAAAAPQRAVIMMVRELPAKGARAVVVRRPSAGRTMDMILVNSSTTAHDLAKAVSTLMYSRRSQGVNIRSEMRANITAAALSRGQPSTDVRRATSDLNRLRLAQIIDVPGIGRGPAIPIATAPPPPPRKR